MKKYKHEDLEYFIETISEIICSNCGNSSVQHGDMYSEDLFLDGWRATNDNVYCPACAKKKLKGM